MKKIILIFFISIMLLIDGCSKPSFCESDKTIEVKKTNKVIGKQAEKYLGEITSILNGEVELINKHSQSKDSYYIYDVYFDFSEEDMNLYFLVNG